MDSASEFKKLLGRGQTPSRANRLLPGEVARNLPAPQPFVTTVHKVQQQPGRIASEGRSVAVIITAAVGVGLIVAAISLIL